MPDLATFQQGFAQALLSDGAAHPFPSPAFAVYRNTCARGVVEALRASYPTVDMLVGEDMFGQVALDYRCERPPGSPVLSDYGADFPSWLERQAWTSDLPYLADVARLDRLWLESFLAPAAAQPPASRGGTAVMLHPAARFALLATPAMTIWQAHRAEGGIDELEPEWREEWALFTRPGNTVQARQVDAATHQLLQCCTTPTPVGRCLESIAAAFPETDAPTLLRTLVGWGALVPC